MLSQVMAKRISFALGAVLLGTATPSSAAFVSGTITGGTVAGSSNIIVLNPSSGGFTVGNNNFNTNNLYVFAERTNVLVSSALSIDANTTIATGTYLNSYLVVFDPLPLSTIRADLTFGEPVLGMARRDPTLTATNALFGAPGVTYDTIRAYGLEGGEDTVLLRTPSANAIRLRFSADSPGDVVRIFTQGNGPVTAVPEPTTWAMMIFGFGVVGSALRRQRSRVAIAHA